MLEKTKGLIKSLGKRKKLLVVVVVVLVAILFLPKLFGGGGGADGLPVSTGEISKMDVEEIVSLKGIITGSETAEIASPLNYEIISINVKEGDKVEKGQILAVLDGQALKDELSIAETRLEMTQATAAENLENEQKAYNDAKSTYDLEKSRFDKKQILYNEGAISKDEYESAKNELAKLKSALSKYNVSGGKVSISGSQQKSIEMERESLAQKREDLDKTYIKSPITGTVTRVNAKLGRYANDTEDKKPMFVVEELDNLKINVKVGEFDIGRIALGQKVAITSDVKPGETAYGVVSNISPSGEKKDQSTNEMVIPVQIDITDNTPKLIAGVNAKVNIEIAKKASALAVPVDGILELPDTGEKRVFVVQSDSTIKGLAIQTGVSGDFYSEVIGGELKEGDKIVLNPTFDLTDGMKITEIPNVATQPTAE